MKKAEPSGPGFQYVKLLSMKKLIFYVLPTTGQRQTRKNPEPADAGPAAGTAAAHSMV